jgi:hypothetical protein
MRRKDLRRDLYAGLSGEVLIHQYDLRPTLGREAQRRSAIRCDLADVEIGLS